MRLSIVIPTWNEAENLASTLAALPRSAEPIVADGGSIDATVEVARRAGARVVPCERGRARQMNAGASAARGDVLLFLHADGILGEGAARAIERALEDGRTVGGSFRLRIRNAGPALRLVAFGSNSRARYLGAPYGDQGIFLRRATFETAGGFPEVPFLEDVALIKVVRRLGRLVQLDVPLETGDRHWKELGVVATTALNWTAVGLYLMGFPPERLAPAYFRWRGVEAEHPEVPQPLAQPD